ncbi:MAG: bifunctional hydroxymethylpyrimidine kinase/phosphomethylpyrimidine kinase [Burkholderiales bacterium]|jgi:hydroxymethylpyrimidine/phosphomethylpyrimidine kinase
MTPSRFNASAGSSAPAGASAASGSRHPARIANTLSIAGIDPSGGAGLFTDLRAFAAMGTHGCGVVAALTAQNSQAVTGISMVDSGFVRQQLDTLFDDVRIDAIKIGMLGAPAVIRVVAEVLERRRTALPSQAVVLDPVMIAKSGDALLQRDAESLLIEAMVPLASVITPNLPEAGVLLRVRAPETVAEMRRAAEKLRRLMRDDGARWVLLKGGHLNGEATDLLHDGDRMIELTAPRIETRNTHGTGCTLSSALAALLARLMLVEDRLPREPVEEAVRYAKRWLTEAIRRSGELTVGTGHGPVHAFHSLWGQA